MDKLKHFIDTNKEAFEDDLLPAGHFGRFEKKLQKETRKKNKTFRLALYTLVGAASIALVFLFNFRSYLGEEGFTKEIMCENYESIKGLQLYYHMQMENILAEMEMLHEKVPGGDEILEEGKEVIMASTYFETHMIPSLPCSNDGVFAMTQHYSNSLESLQIMLNHMQKVIQIQNNK